VVIGAGNVAMDTARTLARLQRQAYGRVGVTVTALEAFSHFLADLEEVREAREEGIEILDARGPREVVLEDGEVAGLITWQVLSIFDPQGRLRLYVRHGQAADKIAADIKLLLAGN